MKDIFSVIQRRKSVRNYQLIPLQNDHLKHLKELAEGPWRGPFETEPFFRIIDLSHMPASAKGKLGSYGLIRGDQTYIAGACEDSDEGLTDLGYCLESIILEATALGVGTCWLGGTFKKTVIQSLFTEKFGMKPLQTVPAITPIGYEVPEKALLDRVLKAVMKTHLRKSWEELFFMAGGEKPLSEMEAGAYKDCLEAVRIAPSAVNKQPWRVCKEAGKSIFHFYTVGGMYLDIGIAMAHFELVAKEKGLQGTWVQDAPSANPSGLQYVISWKATDDLMVQFE